MRLKLTVERQEHPPTRILWNADALRPNHVGDRGHTTIAQLLEQISEVIPLEAADWGLDDYVVEVNRYECLHFCSIQIFKEDEEVTVRPLQASDLRYRRILGRHQISADGKHLIDGVAFGRPFLRRSDRPAIRIPPRKRIRTTYNDDEDEGMVSEALNQQQILVRSSLNDAADEASEDNENDTDYRIDHSDVSDLASELNDLTRDLHNDKGLEQVERTVFFDGAEEQLGRITRSRKRRKLEGLGIRAVKPLNQSGHDESQYAGTYHNPLLDQYYQEKPIQVHGEKAKHRRGVKYQSVNINRLHGEHAAPQSSRRSSSASLKGVRFEEGELETPATIRQVSGSEFEDNESFIPDRGTATDFTEANKENVQPGKMAKQLRSVVYNRNEVVLLNKDDEISTDHDSGSVSSDTDSTSSGSSPESSFSPSDSSSSRENANPDQDSQYTQLVDGLVESSSNLVRRSVDMEPQRQSSSTTVPPYQGQPRTKKRNERRRVQMKIQYLKRIGVLSSKANKEDYIQWLKRPDNEDQAPSDEPQAQDEDASTAFEIRRQALLDSIQSGGIAVDMSFEQREEDSQHNEINETLTGQHTPKSNLANSTSNSLPPPVITERTAEDVAATSAVDEVNGDADNDEGGLVIQEVEPQISSVAPLDTLPKSAPQSALVQTRAVVASSLNIPKRRATLDLLSSRRLLFGSLGLRAPKNKEDEDKLRESIMQNVKPSTQINKNVELLPNKNPSDNEKEDQSWRDKIVLKAVECCYDGVELSTPPFPFVQRWDPQQQRKTGGARGGDKTIKRKRNQWHNASEDIKKRKRNRTQYYHQDDADDYIHDATYDELEQADYVPFITLGGLSSNHNGSRPAQLPESDELQNAVDEQLLRDTNVHSVTGVPQDADVPVSPRIDLQQLPQDMSTLVFLTVDKALAGAIIAFKQLDMSQETNWQPSISEYRTAIIHRILEGGSFELSLAQRDRPSRNKSYNVETGERIYSKFEMPDYEDEDSDESNGILNISLAEMIEPKLVEAANAQEHKHRVSHVEKPDIEIVDMSAFPNTDEDQQTPDRVASTTENNITAIVEDHDGLDLQPAGNSEASPNHFREESKSVEVLNMTEESRQEISLIMKDAGFRSNLHSDLDRGIDDQIAQMGFNDQHQEVDPDFQSPRFNGFSSSPPIRERVRQTSSDEEDTGPTITNNKTTSNVVSIEDSQSQNELDGIKGLDDHSTDGAIDDGFIAIDEHSELRDKGNKPSNPALPTQLDGIRSDDPHGSVSSPPPSARITTRGRHLASGRGLESYKNARRSMLDDSESNGFPTIESVFSTAPSRMENLHGEESKIAGADKAGHTTSAKAKLNFPSFTNKRPRRQVRPFSAADIFTTSSASSADEKNLKSKGAEQDTSAVRQAPPGSQFVDLTFSSDPAEPDGSEYEERSRGKGTGLPSGPGWVQKTRNAGKQPLGRKFGARKTRSM